MDFFRGIFNQQLKEVPKPNFEGISALSPEPANPPNVSNDATDPETKRTISIPEGYADQPDNQAIIHSRYADGKPAHFTANIALADIRPRIADDPVDQNPPTRPDIQISKEDAPVVAESTATLVTSKSELEQAASAQTEKVGESMKVDREYVASLFSNPDDIQTMADLLERLEKIKGYSFGQKMKKDDPTQMVELMGVTVWEEFKKIVLPLEEKDESVKIRNKALLKGLMGFTDSTYSSENLDLISRYLQLHSISKDFRIREIAKRLLADQLLIR